MPNPSMPDAAELRARLNQNSVNLLLIDADVALTFADVAETSTDASRSRQAVRDARHAYDVICERRPRFSFSKDEEHTLKTKLQRIKERLTGLGEVFGGGREA